MKHKFNNLRNCGVTTREASQGFVQMSKAMNSPQYDAAWEKLENEMLRRKKETREWFNNLLRFGIVATIIQLVALIFCVWYFTK